MQIKCLCYLADCYCRLGEPEQALKLYDRVDKLLEEDDISGKVTNLNHRAHCMGALGDYKEAESLCQAAIDLIDEESSVDGEDPELIWHLARCYAHRAYFEYMRAKYSSALSWFEKAETKLDESKRKSRDAEILRQKIVFAQAGTFYHLEDYKRAYEQFKRLYEIDSRLLGRTDLETGWAMLALSDVLDRLGREDDAKEWYRKSVYVFRKFNRDRLVQEFNVGASADAAKRIDALVFGTSKVPAGLEDGPEPLLSSSLLLVNTHDPRNVYAKPFTDAPGRVWLNPSKELRGLVIAIHGLSLDHSSFDAFAKKIADSGYETIAFDVRGFGTYRQALGAERIDFDSVMRDLQLVVGAIREDNPGVPLFILGESMGGAIALQFAAQNPELIDGLVASVPAGKRFNESHNALKVALHFLEDKDKPFDIGSDVIRQATNNPKLRRAWAGDPKTRKDLSARELIAFQSMTNRNLRFAKMIDKTPVIIYQGVGDSLVKPEASYDLFRSIKCNDKSFVMVGNAEHLIFEEGCFTPAVIKGLIGWMEGHSSIP